jgi:sigma-E factor negative regulatory protein RseA
MQMQVGKLPSEEQDIPSWESSVSVWMDGEDEIRPEDLDSPYGRQLWDSYHLIGDVLRSEDLAIKPSDLFYARLSKAIDDEPALVMPRQFSRHAGWRMGLSGLAAAAAVASVVWVSLPYLTTQDSIPTVAPQMVVAVAEEPGVWDYLEAHGEIAGAGALAVTRPVAFEAGGSR